MAVSSLPPDTSGLLGAVVSFLAPPLLAALLSGYLVGRWKSRGDYLEKRLDDLCDMIDGAVEDAAQYWSIGQLDQGAPLAESKITAYLMKIAGMRAVVEQHMSKTSGEELAKAEAGFFREATGGDFGVHNRTADMSRIVAIRHSGAQYVVTIRAARMHDLQGLRRRR